jgi:hypothetical protein
MDAPDPAEDRDRVAERHQSRLPELNNLFG